MPGLPGGSACWAAHPTALVTVLVDDLEGFLAGARERGIEAPPIEEIPGVFTSTITDPEGNRIQFGEPQQA